MLWQNSSAAQLPQVEELLQELLRRVGELLRPGLRLGAQLERIEACGHSRDPIGMPVYAAPPALPPRRELATMRRPITVGEAGPACANGRPRVVHHLNHSLNTAGAIYDFQLDRRLSVFYLPLDAAGGLPKSGGEVACLLSIFSPDAGAFGSDPLALIEDRLAERLTSAHAADGSHATLTARLAAAAAKAPRRDAPPLGDAEIQLFGQDPVTRSFAERLAPQMIELGAAVVALRELVGPGPGRHEQWATRAKLSDVDALMDQFYRNYTAHPFSRERMPIQQQLAAILFGDAPAVSASWLPCWTPSMPAPASVDLVEWLVPVRLSAPRAVAGYVLVVGRLRDGGGSEGPCSQAFTRAAAECGEHLRALLDEIFAPGEVCSPIAPHLQEDVARSCIQILCARFQSRHESLDIEPGQRAEWLADALEAATWAAGRPSRPAGGPSPATLRQLVAAFDALIDEAGPAYLAVWRIGTELLLARDRAGLPAIVPPTVGSGRNLAEIFYAGRFVGRMQELARALDSLADGEHWFHWSRVDGGLRPAPWAAGAAAQGPLTLRLPPELEEAAPDGCSLRVFRQPHGMQLALVAGHIAQRPERPPIALEARPEQVTELVGDCGAAWGVLLDFERSEHAGACELMVATDRRTICRVLRERHWPDGKEPLLRKRPSGLAEQLHHGFGEEAPRPNLAIHLGAVHAGGQYRARFGQAYNASRLSSLPRQWPRHAGGLGMSHDDRRWYLERVLPDLAGELDESPRLSAAAVTATILTRAEGFRERDRDARHIVPGAALAVGGNKRYCNTILICPRKLGSRIFLVEVYTTRNARVSGTLDSEGPRPKLGLFAGAQREKISRAVDAALGIDARARATPAFAPQAPATADLPARPIDRVRLVRGAAAPDRPEWKPRAPAVRKLRAVIALVGEAAPAAPAAPAARLPAVTAKAGAPAFPFGIVTQNKSMLRQLDEIKKLAQDKTSVLITGESGTGKELFARALHQQSKRAGAKLSAVNCGAIHANLSELFGHVKGSFTGADRDEPGLLVAASGGTLFLDEIGDLSLEMQVKLLRAIEERKCRQVGATRDVPFDVRLVCATHHDLAADMRDGRFREDFFYRIHVANVHLPPLRDRAEDIPLLAEHFLALFNKEGSPRRFGEGVTAALAARPWPGNIRQLRNAIERARALADDLITPLHFAGSEAAAGVDAPLPPAPPWLAPGETLDEPRKRELLERLIQLDRALGASIEGHDDRLPIAWSRAQCKLLGQWRSFLRNHAPFHLHAEQFE